MSSDIVQESEAPKAHAIAWLVAVGVLLTLVVTALAGLMKNPLGVDTTYASIVGLVLVISSLTSAAPKTKRQAGQVALIIGGAGILAAAVALVPELLGWGFWGNIFGTVLGTMLGSLIIALSFKRWGIAHRLQGGD